MVARGVGRAGANLARWGLEAHSGVTEALIRFVDEAQDQSPCTQTFCLLSPRMTGMVYACIENVQEPGSQLACGYLMRVVRLADQVMNPG